MYWGCVSYKDTRNLVQSDASRFFLKQKNSGRKPPAWKLHIGCSWTQHGNYPKHKAKSTCQSMKTHEHNCHPALTVFLLRCSNCSLSDALCLQSLNQVYRVIWTHLLQHTFPSRLPKLLCTNERSSLWVTQAVVSIHIKAERCVKVSGIHYCCEVAVWARRLLRIGLILEPAQAMFVYPACNKIKLMYFTFICI